MLKLYYSPLSPNSRRVWITMLEKGLEFELINNYPKLNPWCDRLMARPAWQKTEATPEAIETLKTRMAARMSIK